MCHSQTVGRLVVQIINTYYYTYLSVSPSERRTFNSKRFRAFAVLTGIVVAASLGGCGARIAGQSEGVVVKPTQGWLSAIERDVTGFYFG